MPDISSFASAVSAILAFVIAYEAYKAYNYTEREYLLAFVVGFTLLALSYAVLIPLAFGIRLDVGYQYGDVSNYPPRMVMQSIGFILVGLAYSQSPKVKYFLYTLVAALVVLVFIVILPVVQVPSSVNAILYLINSALILYVLQRMLRKTKPTDLVLVGFATMGLSQYTALIDILQSGELTSFLSQTIRVVSLTILFVAFLRMEVPSHARRMESRLIAKQEI